MSELFAEVRTGAADGFGLGGGYFLGGRTAVRQPVGGVPSSRPPSARQPNRPGQAIPAGQTPIPASSAKPGNREGNQRIPYARFMYTFPSDTAAPRDLVDGDIVFVHKCIGAMGTGTNRLVKSTGIPQLNALLANEIPGTTTLDVAAPGIGRRIKEARVRDAYATYQSTYHAGDVVASDYYRKLYEQQQTAPEVADLKDVDVYRDWQAVITLSEWTLDGVLISADDDELDVETHKDSRHDGILLNVCVQGPTLVRNSKWNLERATVDRELLRNGKGAEGSAWGLQVIDDGMIVQDKVFCGLFVREVTDGPDGTGTLLHYAFYYKLFSGRQAYAMAILNGEAGRAGFADLRRVNPAPFAQGPSEQEFRRLVGVWRVGTVMDNRAVAGDDPHITLNVCVEWWPMWKPFVDTGIGSSPPARKDVNWIQREYGNQIGKSLTVALKGPIVIDEATRQAVLLSQAAAKKVAETNFQEAYNELRTLDEAFANVITQPFTEAMEALEEWAEGTDVSNPEPSLVSFFRAAFDIVNGGTTNDILTKLDNGEYREAEEVARQLETVFKDKPEARSLLTQFQQDLANKALQLLGSINLFSGLRDRINRIAETRDGEVADALLNDNGSST